MTANRLTTARPAAGVPPASADFLSDVIAGLSSEPRTLPCKYFYDERGAALFQKICELPEYYITRTEIDILDRHRAEIAAHLGAQINLIGLGTGSGTKTRILIEALEKPAGYIPVDISEKQLRKSTALFHKIFPDLEILPVCADYLQPVALPSTRRKTARNVVYFPGSTIGNFEPDEATQFLRRVAKVCRRGGALLIGVDLRKDRDVLEAAYNDSRRRHRAIQSEFAGTRKPRTRRGFRSATLAAPRNLQLRRRSHRNAPHQRNRSGCSCRRSHVRVLFR